MKKKILVLREMPLREFIQSVPAFAAIRKFHKDDHITIMTDEPLLNFCEHSGFFDRGWSDSRAQWFEFGRLLRFIRKLRRAKFDMVYDLQNNKRSEWYFRLAGFDKPMWNSSIIDWCSHPYKPGKESHYQDIIHNQLRVAGITSTPQIDISYLANNEADVLPEKYAMICPAGDKAKLGNKWHPTKYAEVIDHLHEVHGITSVIIGNGFDDMSINSLVANQCTKAKPINFTNNTSVEGIIAVAKKALFCLGNETAPTHIAAYTGCKTIMICSRFSPSDSFAPKVSNLALIEEARLEDVEIDRALRAIHEFAMAKSETELKDYKTISDNMLERPPIFPKFEKS